jgi:UDP:flavonoid glycosyltransferase YjiC (YdhE family)
MPHLLIAVTAHGYGHLAQVAPLAHELRQRLPALAISVQGTVDPAFVRTRMPSGCRHLPQAADVPLPMSGPLETRWDDGLVDYIAFEAAYSTHAEQQRQLFEQARPDLVLADIPWLPLDVARTLGIPAIGLCSLNWYDILLESPVAEQVPSALAERMRAAYAGANLFLRPAPSMPMRWLPNGRDIGPIARPYPREPGRLRAQLGRPATERLVLMQFGGIGRLPLGGGRRLLPGVQLLSPDQGAADQRDDLTVIGTEACSVLQALASCDALITKPGYGAFAEAACSGVPVLSLERRDWPESRWLLEWLSERVPVRQVSAEAFAAGEITAPLQELLAAGPATPVEPTGVAEAAELLMEFLSA